MTGPTQPADDLRARIAKKLIDVAHDYGHAGSVMVEVSAATDALMADVVAPLRDEATAAHGRNLVLRSEHRQEVAWLSEACRLTVADAAIARDQRGRLHRDATKARETLIELIGGDWTVEPSLTELAGYAARFWGDDRKEIKSLRAAVSRLSGGNTPADAAEAERALRQYIEGWLHGWHDVWTDDEMAAALAKSLMDDVFAGWGSAVATPQPAAEVEWAVRLASRGVLPQSSEDAAREYVAWHNGGGATGIGRAELVKRTTTAWAPAPSVGADPEDEVGAETKAHLVTYSSDETGHQAFCNGCRQRKHGTEEQVHEWGYVHDSRDRDAALLVIAEDRARRDTGERHDLDEVLAELREDEKHHDTLNPPLAHVTRPGGCVGPTCPQYSELSFCNSTRCRELAAESRPTSAAYPADLFKRVDGLGGRFVCVCGLFVASREHHWRGSWICLPRDHSAQPPAAVADTAHERTDKP